MKWLLFIGLLATFGLIHSSQSTISSSAASQITPDEVYYQIETYARQRTGRLRMMRGGANQIRCYDAHIPRISEVAERGKNESHQCILDADAKREAELQLVQEQRSSLDERVQSVRHSLNNCTDKEDVIEYLICLRDSAEENRKAIEMVEEISISLYEKLNSSFEIIRSAEHRCIGSVIDEAKRDTDEAFTKLQDCLINGFVEPQPKPDPESNPKPTSEPEPQPSTDPELETEPQPEPQPEPEPEPQPEPEPEPQPQPRPDPVTEPQPEPEPQPDPDPNPEQNN